MQDTLGSNAGPTNETTHSGADGSAHLNGSDLELCELCQAHPDSLVLLLELGELLKLLEAS